MFRNFKTLNFISKRCFQSTSSTIFALSTNIKSSGSAIAVIRVAGPETSHVIDKLTNGNSERFLKNPRKAILQNVYDRDELIDKSMMLWLPGPKSYTGDDMCEFHIHGSQAIIAKMFRVLFEVDGCRPATEGEFTKRALINGKVGLIEAEAIGDLIKAKTDLQRKRALSVFSGSIDEKLNAWRQELIKDMAHLEAYIDFAEDELIEDNVMTDFVVSIQRLSKEIKQHLSSSARRSDLIKDGVKVAIIGEANVGKSSLMNRLCQRNLSIVSPISGTTRDVIEGHLDFAGYSLSIADTAGIKELFNTTNIPDGNLNTISNVKIDMIEQEGIKRALQHAQDSHLLIVVLDATKQKNPTNLTLSNHVKQAIVDKNPEEIVYVINKIDLLSDKDRAALRKAMEEQFLSQKSQKPPEMDANKLSKCCLLSCDNGEGLAELIATLEGRVESLCGDPSSDVCYSNDRHVMHLTQACQLLDSIRTDGDLAIAASVLRQAAHELACLTGSITTDDVLDIVFRDFCIGK